MNGSATSSRLDQRAYGGLRSYQRRVTDRTRGPPERLVFIAERFIEMTDQIPTRLGARPARGDFRLGVALVFRRRALAGLRSLPKSASRDQVLDSIDQAERRLADTIARHADGIRDLARLEFGNAAESMDEFTGNFDEHPGEELENLLDTRSIACELTILLGTLGEDRRALDRRLAAIDAELRAHAGLIHRMVFGDRPRWTGSIPDEYWWLRIAEVWEPE